MPNPAINPEPIDGFTNIPQTQSLNWCTGGGAPTSYDVYFGTSAIPPFVINQTATTFTPTELEPETTYYWKIVPRNNLGQALDCPVWSFITLS